jgi:hypothetical protein
MMPLHFGPISPTMAGARQLQHCSSERQPELTAEAHAGAAAERQTQGRQPGVQALRPTRPGEGNPGQALGKNAARTAGVPTEQPAYPQPDGDGVRAPGQIGECALVAAVGALGPPAAERAACRNPARLKGDSDRRLNRIEMPGCEPNVGPVWQKVRKQVHSPHMATPNSDHQNWPRAAR